MTFEQYFKNWIKDKIKTATGMDLAAVNDSGYKIDEALKSDSNSGKLFVIVKGGNASKSNVPNYDLNTLQILVSVICYENDKNDIISDLQEMSETENALLNTATINGNTVKFKAILNTPFLSGTTFDMRKNADIAKGVLIQQMINVNYGQNAYIAPHAFQLIVGSTTYDINYISHYERAVNAVTDTFQKQGNTIQGVSRMATVNTVSLTIFKVGSDTFQNTILDTELNFAGSLLGATIQLKIDGGSAVTISEYSVSETYENNTAAYLLTLKR